MSAKKISVVVPVYNAEKYIAQALDSLISQTLPPDEIIVVNDGSTDGSAEVVASFASRVKLVSQENSGTANARNRGLQESTGDLLAFLDADDFWDPRKLASQKAVLDSNPAMESVFCLARQFYSPDLAPEKQSLIRKEDRDLAAYTTPAMLIRRGSFFRIGLFRAGLQGAVDMEWMIRAREGNLRTSIIRECLYFRRIHADNSGIRNKHLLPQRTRLLKEFLDRKKGANQSRFVNEPNDPQILKAGDALDITSR